MDAATQIKLDLTETVGTSVGTAQDAHIGLVRGYKAARNPALVELRAATNEARIAAITAKLMADLDS